jgi:hypothetical protein
LKLREFSDSNASSCCRIGSSLQVASSVPSVQQVVNNLQIRNQKASSPN